MTRKPLQHTFIGFLIHLAVIGVTSLMLIQILASGTIQQELSLVLLPPTTIQKEARLEISPANATALKGGKFTAQIVVYPGAVNINAVGATIRYPRELEVVSLSREGSFCTLYPEEYVKKEERLIRIGCGTPSPGLAASSGIVGTIVFRPRETGYTRIEIDQGSSSVHANDGKGTDVLGNVAGTALTIVNPVAKPTPKPPSEVMISSPTHPDQEIWYPSNDVSVRWFGLDLAENTRYATLLSQNPSDAPDPASLEQVNEKSFADLPDGVWYFHLRPKNEFGFGPVSHFQIQIDTTPPELNLLSSATTLTPGEDLQIQFSGEDAERFLVKIDNESFAPETSPLTVSNLSRGKHTIYVRAVDRTGNITERPVTIHVESQNPIERFTDWLRRILL